MIKATYLDDGNVRVETEGIPGAQHMAADAFFTELKRLGITLERVGTKPRTTHQQQGQRARQGR